ncbi:transcriptional Coactivator p15 [Sodiomyces alkalinus F11]|uniref:Transcriptional Coactivator p15 n=1 Tax=Sodiomyces alkalinus (strain CBS 110278 / VKM F-3762 / F11) TaxID=1314773 RepID=A0A3N2Q3X4_SODAK|nr:transcriptional Coactivator p15 [Sodiomyces alkalinus F11]ROT41452.1 transcriptional Coactivator p15 [Sodiomyces alkalinus F11]
MPVSKGTKRSASRVDNSGDEGAPVVLKSFKKSKTAATSPSSGHDKEGNPYWELSNKRRIGVSKFRDMTMINIREFWEKDGEMLPGKKGISLSLQQYENLLKFVPEINAHLRQMGHDVEDSEDAGGVSTSGDGEPKPPKKSKQKTKKSNIEATSDEEEEEEE